MPEHRVAEHTQDDDGCVVSPKPLPTPFDDLRAYLVRLFLLRPMAAVADQGIFSRSGMIFSMAVGGGLAAVLLRRSPPMIISDGTRTV